MLMSKGPPFPPLHEISVMYVEIVSGMIGLLSFTLRQKKKLSMPW